MTLVACQSLVSRCRPRPFSVRHESCHRLQHRRRPRHRHRRRCHLAHSHPLYSHSPPRSSLLWQQLPPHVVNPPRRRLPSSHLPPPSRPLCWLEHVPHPPSGRVRVSSRSCRAAAHDLRKTPWRCCCSSLLCLAPPEPGPLQRRHQPSRLTPLLRPLRPPTPSDGVDVDGVDASSILPRARRRCCRRR